MAYTGANVGEAPAGYTGTMGASTGLGAAAPGAAKARNTYDFLSDVGMGAGLGSVLAGLFGGGGKSPMSAANPYFQQALQQMQGLQQQLPGYFEPYMQAGKWAVPKLEEQYSQLVSDPGALMRRIGGSFQESPGYEFQRQQALEAANRAAVAGGMAGTPAEQEELAKTVTGLANQDYYNYLSRALELYQSGLGGMGGLARMGEQGAGELGQGELGLGSDIANIYGSQAQLAAAQQQAANQQRANKISGLGGLIGAIGTGLSFL